MTNSLFSFAIGVVLTLYFGIAAWTEYSTKLMNKMCEKEYKKYCEWATRNGVPIPPPPDVYVLR